MRLIQEGQLSFFVCAVAAVGVSSACTQSRILLEEKAQNCLLGRERAEEHFDELGCVDVLGDLEYTPLRDGFGRPPTFSNRIYHLEPSWRNTYSVVRYCELAEAGACPTTLLEECDDLLEIEPRNP